jgi:hypothetical protein
VTARRYGSNIPQARDRLLALADRIDGLLASGSEVAREVRRIVAEDMHQKPQLRARGEFRKTWTVSEAEWAEARRLYFEERWPQQRIAEHMGINSGRLSEHLARWEPMRRTA